MATNPTDLISGAAQALQQLLQNMNGVRNPPIGAQNSQGQTIVGRTANNPGQGIDMGSVIQALIGGQRQQQQDMLFNFGKTSKPMQRQNIGGQYEGDPNALPTGLDAFYAMNKGRAGRDATGAPLQGDAAFMDRMGPLATIDVNARNRSLSSPIDATNRGFSGGSVKFGTSGNDSVGPIAPPLVPMPQVDPMAIAQDVWKTLGQNPNAFSQPKTKSAPKKKSTSTSFWDAFNGGGRNVA